VCEQRRALITGISGQDGSYLAAYLLEQGYDVWGVVRRSPSDRYANLEHIRDSITLVQGDILDQMTMLDAMQRSSPHELYNLAATSFVPASWQQPVMTAQFTAVGVTSLLEAIRIVDPQIRFYQASSSEVFGATTESPQRETTPFLPRTPYGVAKLYAQLMVSAYRTRYGLHASSGISFNHESPRRPTEFVSRKVTRAAAAIKLGLQDELVMGSLDAVRDWSFAGDQAEAMWQIMQQPEGGDYVISSGIGHTVRQLVEAAFGYVDLDPDQYLRIDPQFVRPPEPIALIGDNTKLQETTGWVARTTFTELVELMVEHDLRDLEKRAAERAAINRS
jgi:GDPmannose 4,6-dehydratase